MHTLNIQLEGNDIQKFLNMAKEQFDIKIKVLDRFGVSLLKEKKNNWDTIDKELRNLKTIDIDASKELDEALDLLGKGLELTDFKTARDEYLTHKYEL